MLILILGLIFGIVLLILVGRSVKKNSRERLRYGDRLIKITEIIKILLLFVTALYVIAFIIGIIKTWMV